MLLSSWAWSWWQKERISKTSQPSQETPKLNLKQERAPIKYPLKGQKDGNMNLEKVLLFGVHIWLHVG